MGTTVETLKLLFDPDMAKGVREIEKSGAAVKKNFKESQSSLDKWGAGLTKAGAGMVGFGGAALFGLSKLAHASEEANKPVLKLQNSLKNNPRLAGENAKTYTDLATAIQGKTAADADDITGGIAVLAQGKLNARQMKELIPLTVDFARKKGIDETAAFTLASKAAGGNALVLKKQGIAVDENLAKTDAYRATVEALRNSVGGFAEEEGKTFSGSMERLKNQLGDLEENVGAGVVDAFTEMAGAAGGVANKLNSLDPGVSAGIGKWATYGAVALTAAGGLSFVAGQAITARQRFGTLATAVSNNTDTLAKLGSGAVNAAIGIGVLYEAAQVVDDLFRETPADANKLENALLRVGDSGKVSGELASHFGKNLGELKEAVNSVISPDLGTKFEHVTDSLVSFGGHIPLGTQNLRDMRGRIDEVDKALATLAARSPKAAADALNQLIDKLGLTDAEAKRFRQSLNDYSSTLAEVDTTKAVSGSEKLTKAQREQAEATTKADDALKEELDTLRAEFDPLFAMQDSLLDNAKAQQKLTESTTAQQKAQDAHNKAVARYGEDSKTARKTAGELAAANQDLAEATLSADKSAVDFSVAQRTLSEKLANGSIKIGEARQQMYDMAIAAGASREKALMMAASFDVVAAHAKKVPPKVTTQVAAPGLTSVMSQLGAFVANYANKTLNVGVTATATKIGGINIGGGIRVFGDGGEVTGGPKGSPKLIMAHVGETVVPTHDEAAMRRFTAGRGGGAGGGGAAFGGGPTVIINNDFRGAFLPGTDQVERAVGQAVDGAMRKGYVTTVAAR